MNICLICISQYIIYSNTILRESMTDILNDWKKAHDLGIVACETDQGLKIWTENKGQFAKKQILELNPRYLELLASMNLILKKKSDDDMKLHFENFVLGNQKEEHFVMQMFRIALLNQKDGKLEYQRVMQIAYNIGQFTKACELKMYTNREFIIDMCTKNRLMIIDTYISL